MTEEDLPSEYREIPQVQKKSNRKYWQKQNAKRMNVGLSRELMHKFRDFRELKNFKNDDQMLEYLLDIAEDAQTLDLVKEKKVCAKCGDQIIVALSDYTGINHQKIDKDSNCFGSIVTKYGLKDIKDKQQEPRQKSEDKPLTNIMTF